MLLLIWTELYLARYELRFNRRDWATLHLTMALHYARQWTTRGVKSRLVRAYIVQAIEAVRS